MRIIMTFGELKALSLLEDRLQELLKLVGVPPTPEYGQDLILAISEVALVYPNNIRVDHEQKRVIFSSKEEDAIYYCNVIVDFYDDMRPVFTVLAGLWQSTVTSFKRMEKRLKA